jgi:hypothetical protein
MLGDAPAQRAGLGRQTDFPRAGDQPQHSKGTTSRPAPYRQPRRKKALDGQEAWLRERLRRHRGNADVIRQELAAEKGIIVSLRTLERAVQPCRQELVAERGRRCGLRRRPASKCRSILANAWSRSAAGVLVRGHPWLFAPASHSGIPQRARGELVRRPGKRVGDVRRRAGRSIVRQRPGMIRRRARWCLTTS